MTRRECLYIRDSIKIMKGKGGDEQQTMKVSLKEINVMDGVGIQHLMKCMKDIL